MKMYKYIKTVTASVLFQKSIRRNRFKQDFLIMMQIDIYWELFIRNLNFLLLCVWNTNIVS